MKQAVINSDYIAKCKAAFDAAEALRVAMTEVFEAYDKLVGSNEGSRDCFTFSVVLSPHQFQDTLCEMAKGQWEKP